MPAAVARFGQADRFFGNLYEALVDAPQLLADAHNERPPRVLGPGRPVRYYAPAAPLTPAATAATLIDRWRAGDSKTMIAAAAVATGSAAVRLVALAGAAPAMRRTASTVEEGHQRDPRHELLLDGEGGSRPLLQAGA